MLSLQLLPQLALPVPKATSLPGMPGGLVYISVGTDSSSCGPTLPGETILEKAVAQRSLGLQKLTQAPVAAAEVQAPPQARLAPPHPATSGPHSCKASGGPAAQRGRRAARTTGAGALSRRSWPGSGCNHGKERGQPETQGLPLPGCSEGILGAAALTGQGGRYCPRLRVQTRHCWC